MKELPKAYNPKQTEDKIYQLWEKSGFFNPDNLPRSHKKPFTILMPPPNASNPLHAGNAVMIALEDIMIRYHRMKGEKTLWLPGEDHAGFETQVVYEKKLEKEGRARFQMTREQFYAQVWRYTQENRAVVRNQIKKLGASCDWSRDTFTLDPPIVKIVYDTFKRMYEDRLIYRGERLVNYCTKHRTAFSELEIKHEERKDPLYYMKYGPITLATVRPETKFGDTAIAVHPKDKRYLHYIGKELEVETVLGKKKIKVIADESVDPQFGTGAVKVTPAHDFNDFETWQRHKQEIPGPLQVIGQDGKLTQATGPYAGMKVLEARQKVAEDMQIKGLMEKIDQNYTHTVALCYKCNSVIEPMLMAQWFVRVEPLAKAATEAVKRKKIAINPKNQEKIFFHWMKNIRDWNISRQNWWGISIPAWHCVS
jgi:valyl-tRNA synthetase